MTRTPGLMVDGKAIDGLDVSGLSALLADATAHLPPDHSAAIFNLSGLSGTTAGDAAYRIFAANAFRTGIGDGEPDLHSVFRDVSRINHGCQPNCAYFFNAATLTQSVFAVMDVMSGEELTIGYIDPVQTREERHAHLHRHWGFRCTCSRCSAQPHIIAESDERVRSIRALWKELDNYTIDGTGTPAKAELLVLLCELEGLHGRMHEALYRLALEWNGVGDGVRATQAARRCLARGLLVRGPDQVFVRSMQELIADPAKHWSWRFRERARELREAENRGGLERLNQPTT